MKKIHYTDGFICKDDSLRLRYRLKDHLGNPVVIFEDVNKDGRIDIDTTGLDAPEVIERMVYYPFGLSFDGLYDASGKHELGSRYKFGGKEVVSGIYDFGARYYYPAIGRFMGVDPLAEDYAGVSPYAYVLNNPLQFIDPTGMSVETVNNEYILNVRTGTHTKISDYGGDAFDVIHVRGADSPVFKDFMNVPGPFGAYSYRVDNKGLGKRIGPGQFMDGPASGALKPTYPIFETMAGGATGKLLFKGAGRVLSKIAGNGTAANTSTSLGAGRTGAKNWLQNVGNLERGQLIKDIESVGFKRVSPLESPSIHYQRGGMKIRLDAPDRTTHFNHMHLNYGGKYGSYDINLRRVRFDSKAAHIPIK